MAAAVALGHEMRRFSPLLDAPDGILAANCAVCCAAVIVDRDGRFYGEAATVNCQQRRDEGAP